MAFVSQGAGDRSIFLPKEATRYKSGGLPSLSSPRGIWAQCPGLRLLQDPSPGGRDLGLSWAPRKPRQRPILPHLPSSGTRAQGPTPLTTRGVVCPDYWFKWPPRHLEGSEGFLGSQNDPRNLALHQGRSCHLAQVRSCSLSAHSKLPACGAGILLLSRVPGTFSAS